MAHARAALEGLLDAIEARDAQAVLDALADDVTMEAEALATPIRGKQVLRDMLAGTMGAYDSVRIERKKIVESGRDVAALLGAHVKVGRDIEMMGETLPTAGKELDVLGAVFAEVDDAGKIKRLMRVRDTLGVVQQLGLSPEHMRRLTQKLEEQLRQRPRAA